MNREMPAPVLAVNNLSISFRHGDSWQKVVRNISFSLYPGKTLAIVGESGSGKSVTAMAIMRLLFARHSRTEGQVLLGGQSLLELPEEEMRRVRGAEVAMIFQEPMTSLNPAFTIGNQIAEVFIRHQRLSARQAKQEAIALLEKVRIPHAAQRFDEYPHQFSGGMRQRAMIAMALALKPKLLIADEPTTALDVTIQGQILDLMKTLQAENKERKKLHLKEVVGIVPSSNLRKKERETDNGLSGNNAECGYCVCKQPASFMKMQGE